MLPSLAQNTHVPTSPQPGMIGRGNSSVMEMSISERKILRLSSRLKRTLHGLDTSPVIENIAVTEKRIRFIISQLTKVLGDDFFIVPENRLFEYKISENDPNYIAFDLFKSAISGLSEAAPSESDRFHRGTIGIGLDDDLVSIFSSKDWFDREFTHHSAIQQIQRVVDQLTAISQKGLLTERALIDPLTGIANRGPMNQMINDSKKFLRQRTGSIGVIMIDIDRFKEVNDTYGHPAGDDILRQVAYVFAQEAERHFSLNEVNRKCNLPGYHDKIGIFRMGGEEFSYIIRECNEEQAQDFAEHIREQIEKTNFRVCNKLSLKITVSIGFTTAKQVSDMDSIFNKVDLAVYNAKHSGRNKVVAYSSELETPDEVATSDIAKTGDKTAELKIEQRSGPRIKKI